LDEGSRQRYVVLGIGTYPWDQFAEEIAKTGETEFQAIERRGNAGEVFKEACPQGAETIVGATLVIRSRTIVTALNMVSELQNAPQATARMLFKMADALPVGAQLDLIISSDAVLTALGAYADILTKGLDIDFYCQDPEWNNMMKTWKNKQLHAVCRKVEEEGLDADNSPFLKLALQEVIQIVKDTVGGEEGVPEKELELISSDQ
jgi:hypothetical protein